MVRSVFMMTDIEGVAGVVSFDQTYPDGKYLEAARVLLTEEVNAAVDGLLSEGVEEVIVCDGHGPGGISFDHIHPRAKLIHGRPTTIHLMLSALTRCDVSMIVGQHARSGLATSNLNHTQSSMAIDWVTLNGTPIGEIAQFALYCGAHNIPMIALTGERLACQEAEQTVPGITTVCVKEGLGRTAALTLSKHAARDLIREGMKEAVRKHRRQPVKPLVWDGPFEIRTRFQNTGHADARMTQMGFVRIDDQTVAFRGDKITDVIYKA